MSTIEIIHIADIHISTKKKHLNQIDSELPINESIDALGEVYYYCKNISKADTKILLFGGDLYQNRNPTANETMIAHTMFKLISKEVNHVILIEGNHDTPLVKGTTGVIDLLGLQLIDSLPITVSTSYTGIQNYEIGNLNIVTIPFSRNWEKPLKEARELSKSDMYNILAIHQPIYGAEMDSIINRSEDIVTIESLAYDWQLVLAGDIHKRQILEDKIYYPGSLTPSRLSEVGRHGFTIFRFNNTLQEVKYYNTPHIEITNYIDINSKDNIEEKLNRIIDKNNESGYILRYQTDNLETVNKIKEVAKEYNIHNIIPKINTRPDIQSSNNRSTKIIQAKSLSDKLNVWLKHYDFDEDYIEEALCENYKLERLYYGNN